VGYRCSAIRTRFARNEDKCVLPTFHLWPFLPQRRLNPAQPGPRDRDVSRVALLNRSIPNSVYACRLRRRDPLPDNVIKWGGDPAARGISVIASVGAWFALILTRSSSRSRECRRNNGKQARRLSTPSGTWQFIPRIFDATSERVDIACSLSLFSFLPRHAICVLYRWCFAPGEKADGTLYSGRFASLRLSPFLSLSLSPFFSRYVAWNTV